MSVSLLNYGNIQNITVLYIPNTGFCTSMILDKNDKDRTKKIRRKMIIKDNVGQ